MSQTLDLPAEIRLVGRLKYASVESYVSNSCLMTVALFWIRYITSDCDAVSIIHDSQGYAKVPEDAVGDVLKAGMYCSEASTLLLLP